MNPALEILAPGLHTSVQDLGRIGWQAIGVPVSGALDSPALRLANCLVGNPPGAAALEILLAGPRLLVAAERVRLALAGADARLVIAGALPRTVPAWRSVCLVRGDVASVVVGRRAACCVLAVEGGIAVPDVLGSASTYGRAAIGGFAGRPLRGGDRLPLALGVAPERTELRLPDPPPSAEEQAIRIVLGPQQDCFTDVALGRLCEAEYRISASADRMGMRLDGPPLPHRRRRGSWPQSARKNPYRPGP